MPVEQKGDTVGTAQIPQRREKTDADILSKFSPGDQAKILYRQKVLSSLAYFIGKDFKMPVQLNEPGGGWYWNFKKNLIKVDPKDVLEKPMDYSRFVISHEGGHRRITRNEDIPLDVWKEPGFSFLMNAIEDPRDNNFIAEAYPGFKDQMNLAYQMDIDFESESKKLAKNKLGYTPRFWLAGTEYIRQWFNEAQGKDINFRNIKFTRDLPKDVQEVVAKTLISARDSWLRYPTKVEADKGEESIKKYAKTVYEINLEEIWPEYKKLVKKDLEDQKVQQMLQDFQGEGEEGGNSGLPQEMKDKLTPEEEKELSDAIDQAKKNSNKPSQGQDKNSPSSGRVIDLDSLSEGLKQKIRDYLNSLPEDQRKELEEKAKEALKGYEDEINDKLEGKLADNPLRKMLREKEKTSGEEESEKEKEPQQERTKVDEEKLKEIRQKIDQVVHEDANEYEKYRREVLSIIDDLENDLRQIFVKRRLKGWLTGFKTGKRIDIKKRMEERAKQIPVTESRAWKRLDLPLEKDYAISLLVDLSGSMVHGNKITETFKSIIVLAEVLNRLSIQTEILGFNSRLFEYQLFGQEISSDIRAHMGSMLTEPNQQGASTDLGWALKETSDRLKKQRVKEKFLIVLSDGMPEPSVHTGAEYDLEKVIKGVKKGTNQKLVGLGIGSGTEHVDTYFKPNSIANVNVREMADRLAELLRNVIANYDQF